METEPITIDTEEEVRFIVDKLKEENIIIDEEVIYRIFELDTDFLQLKGVIQEFED